MKELIVIVAVICSGYLAKYSSESYLVEACRLFESRGADEIALHRWVVQIERSNRKRSIDNRTEHTSANYISSAAHRLNKRSSENELRMNPERIVVFFGKDQAPSSQLENF